ncbi:MAG TPA: DUF2599 domain-containing protein [Gaiellaceae bacterium]|nr:DUF2599 domain-containing protein [Gaiellaceae bacterium]
MQIQRILAVLIAAVVLGATSSSSAAIYNRASGRHGTATAITHRQHSASRSHSTPSRTKRTAGWWARNAWWSWHRAGWTLSVTPSGLAQSWGTASTSRVWRDALAIAGRRSLRSRAYSSLYEQLQCHLWYTFKTPYNLDSWRPVVSWSYELYRRCNP